MAMHLRTDNRHLRSVRGLPSTDHKFRYADDFTRLYTVWYPESTEGKIALIGEEKTILAEPAPAYQEVAQANH